MSGYISTLENVKSDIDTLREQASQFDESLDEIVKQVRDRFDEPSDEINAFCWDIAAFAQQFMNDINGRVSSWTEKADEIIGDLRRTGVSD